VFEFRKEAEESRLCWADRMDDKVMRGRVRKEGWHGTLFHPVQSKSEGKFASLLTGKAYSGDELYLHSFLASVIGRVERSK